MGATPFYRASAFQTDPEVGEGRIDIEMATIAQKPIFCVVLIRQLPDKIPQHERNPMSFKFFVGQAVEYTPIGEKTAGLYKIMRQMPKEDQATDLKYRIKSETEAYERNVPESQLGSDVGAESEYATTEPRLPRSSSRT